MSGGGSPYLCCNVVVCFLLSYDKHLVLGVFFILFLVSCFSRFFLNNARAKLGIQIRTYRYKVSNILEMKIVSSTILLLCNTGSSEMKGTSWAETIVSLIVHVNNWQTWSCCCLYFFSIMLHSQSILNTYGSEPSFSKFKKIFIKWLKLYTELDSSHVKASISQFLPLVDV